MAKRQIDFKEDVLLYVLQQYGTEPEYLWKSYPDYAILRQADNRKWYAVIMSVPYATLGLSGSGKVTLMNVKCSPEMLSLFLPQKASCPPII